MRIVGSICFMTILLFTIAYGQQPAAPGGKAPVKTPAKTKDATAAQPRIAANSDVEQAIARAKARIALQKTCDSLYGKEIKARTGDLQKKMMDLVLQERATESKKYETNANFRKMHESNKLSCVKDSLAYGDTSANRMQRRKDAQNARFEAMKKMRTEEAKIRNSPELLKIRKNIAVLRKQIKDSVAVIIKDDQKCRECYISSNK